MALTDCPQCGNAGILATEYSLARYRCTNRACRYEYDVTHPGCQYGGCTQWADSGMDYCFFHANMLGTTPASWGDQHPCAGYLCPAMLDDGTEYCASCAEERRNPYD